MMEGSSRKVGAQRSQPYLPPPLLSLLPATCPSSYKYFLSPVLIIFFLITFIITIVKKSATCPSCYKYFQSRFSSYQVFPTVTSCQFPTGSLTGTVNILKHKSNLNQFKLNSILSSGNRDGEYRSRTLCSLSQHCK